MRACLYVRPLVSPLDTAETSDSGLLLSAEDIRGLKDTFCRAQAKWYELGTKLGFSSAALREIEKERRANAGDGSTYLSAMLDGWAKAADPPLPTWSHLIKCLQEVEECNVAKAVEELGVYPSKNFLHDHAMDLCKNHARNMHSVTHERA